MYNPQDRARSLRRNLTEPEYRLWHALKHRQLGVKFRRQVPIGPYVADFLCFERRIIIEVDGESHAIQAGDERRDEVLARLGYRVLRFWNHQVIHELDAVVEVVSQELGDRSTPPPPPARGGQ